MHVQPLMHTVYVCSASDGTHLWNYQVKIILWFGTSQTYTTCLNHPAILFYPDTSILFLTEVHNFQN